MERRSSCATSFQSHLFSKAPVFLFDYRILPDFPPIFPDFPTRRGPVFSGFYRVLACSMNHKELLFFLRLSEIFLRLGPYLVGFFLLKQLIAFTFYFRRGVDFFLRDRFFLALVIFRQRNGWPSGISWHCRCVFSQFPAAIHSKSAFI